MSLQLEVQKIDCSCWFKLTWGKRQQISATVAYPDSLSEFYQTWRKAYLKFYQNALRARVPKPKNKQGKIRLPQDWHRQLVQAEAQLLAEFHRWLRGEELYAIRAKIGSESQNIGDNKPVSLFLTCSSELERLPWETWELGAEFGCSVAIARSPINITNTTQKTSKRRRKPRILAILGDDTGLDLKGDRKSLNALQQAAEIELVTWQPQQPAAAIKQQIQQALTDAQGWEVLFFAGHSNETAITGGELAIAPNIALSVSEIAPQLKTAKANGLQFALFNSCSGLSIANSLIDLGLSQVAVMREPIHNQVAQVFLIPFLQALTSYQNVHQALIAAEEYLKQKQNLTYPSAYMIPSLFCHPDAQLFQIEPWGWKQQLGKWLPTRKEAIALSAFAVISLLPSVQSFLLEGRVLVQSIYRDLTGQIPPETTPPVLLVQIDDESIREAGIKDPHPMDRSYLANIVDHLTGLNAQVVGIDYLFDDHQQPDNDPILAQSVRNAIAENDTWFIFAGIIKEGTEIGVSPKTGIADPNWSLQGYTNALPQYVKLPESTNCDDRCPFTYLLAIASGLHRESSTSSLPQPKLNSQEDFRTQVIDYLNQIQTDNNKLLFLQRASPHPFAKFAQSWNRFWLRPIIDFSIPPDVVYDRLPAWQLVTEPKKLTNNSFDRQITIIAPGGYPQAGVNPGEDNFSVPLAVAYWRTRFDLPSGHSHNFTGSEINAYMIHHLLTQRLVVPIPELWAIAVAALLGKGFTLLLPKHYYPSRQWAMSLASVTAIFGLVGLQLYLTAGVLLPWLLPSATFLLYVWSSLRSKSHE